MLGEREWEDHSQSTGREALEKGNWKPKSLFTVVREYWGVAQKSQKSQKSPLLSTVRGIGQKRWGRRGKRETENRESKVGARH